MNGDNIENIKIEEKAEAKVETKAEAKKSKGLMIIALGVFLLLISIILMKNSSVSSFLISKSNSTQLRSASEQVDYTNMKWTTATTSAAWAPRDAQVVAAFKGYLWLFGGLNGNGHVEKNGMVEYWNAPHFNETWRTKNGKDWELVSSSTPWGGRRSMSAVEFQNKLWIMAGWSPALNKYDNKIWYSEDGLKWIQATSSPKIWDGREGQVVVNYKNKLWLMGGVNFSARGTLNDVWSSENGWEWTKVTDSANWNPRYDHAVAVFKDKMYLTGGLHINTHATESEVWTSEDGKNWQKLVPEWPSRHGHISLNYKNKLWVIGGWHNDPKNDSGINDTWFTEDGVKWTKIKADGPWIGREDHMGDVFDGKMWVTGGMDSNIHWNNDVYFSEINSGI